MSKKILMPLPTNDFDPTESAVPWKILTEAGGQVVIATPNGQKAYCDERMLRGTGLGILAPILQADKNGQKAYHEMSKSSQFVNPISWQDIHVDDYDGLILPGGHAQGMKEYLESKVLQNVVTEFFTKEKIIGAICHGVVLAARSKLENGKSVLFGRKTTALLKSQELLAWGLTCLWLGDYYRTYSITVEDEVRSALADRNDFLQGPLPLARDSAEHLGRGFIVKDRNYISARWPGDAHLFANELVKMMKI